MGGLPLPNLNFADNSGDYEDARGLPATLFGPLGYALTAYASDHSELRGVLA